MNVTRGHPPRGDEAEQMWCAVTRESAPETCRTCRFQQRPADTWPHLLAQTHADAAPCSFGSRWPQTLGGRPCRSRTTPGARSWCFLQKSVRKPQNKQKKGRKEMRTCERASLRYYWRFSSCGKHHQTFQFGIKVRDSFSALR